MISNNSKTLRTIRLAMAAALGILGRDAIASIHYVRANAAPGGSGTSWATAFATLDSALAIVQPSDSIWVARGTYWPATTDGFIVPDAVKLYGGFFGNETALGERVGLFDKTILSGDRGSNDALGLYADNSERVIVISNGGSATLVDGFVITAGRADLIPESDGGGVIVAGASPTIVNCAIVGNYARHLGGGIYVLGNHETYGPCHVRIIDCSISDNAVEGTVDPSGAGGGAGLVLLDAGTPPMSGLPTASTAFLTNCVMKGNNSGGAAHGGAIVVRCNFPALFKPALELVNCLVANNASANNAGAIRADGGAVVNVSLSTIVDNTATGNCGGVQGLGSDAALVIRDSILWGNRDVLGTLEASQISWTQLPTIQFTCVQGLFSIVGVGNLGANPGFVAAGAGDYRLSSASTCRDAGSNGLLPSDLVDLDGDAVLTEPVPIDLDGESRVWSAAGPSTGNVDMGSFEFQWCQKTQGAAGPGNLKLSICGADLTQPGGSATLTLLGGASATTALLIVGPAASSTAIGGGGTLVPAGTLLVLPAALGIDGSFAIQTPATAAGLGVTVYVQAVVTVPTLEVSQALEVHL